MGTTRAGSKEKIILAAIQEIKDHGVRGLSVRRVAERCGVSSGAPYRHFKGKDDLILETLDYINSKWSKRQKEVLEQYRDDLRGQITETCVSYIKFLCEYPEFQSILTMNDNSMTPEQLKRKATISCQTSELLHKYCDSVGMSDDVRERKIYIGRSIVYGAALMINAGIMKASDETFETIRYCVRREFDIE